MSEPMKSDIEKLAEAIHHLASAIEVQSHTQAILYQSTGAVRYPTGVAAATWPINGANGAGGPGGTA